MKKTILIALALAGCALTTTVEDEKREGRGIARDVETVIGLYPSRSTEWVNAVGRRLVGHLSEKDRSRWEFAFDVVDMEEPNAFALPGGHIYVSRGLLALVTSEDELAGVVGHEIIHVTERHATARAKRAILPSILTFPGRVVGVVNDDLGNLVAAPFEVVGGLRLASYSRSQEEESDKLGAKLSAKAGYDPKALATILGKLEKDATRLMGGKERKPSFFDDHPSTPSRTKDIEKDSRKIKWVPGEPIESWNGILATLDGVVWGPNPARGVFRERLYLQPDRGFALRFPDGWKTVSTNAFAGAVRGEDAVVAISVSGTESTPVAEGRAFEEKLAKKDITPDQQRPLDVNGFPAYLIRISEKRSDDRIYIVWVRIGALTHTYVGMGKDSDRAAIMATLETLRPITDVERDSVDVVRLHPARARGGETLANLTDRTRSAWPASYEAIVNDLPERGPLEEGKLVKIANREAYIERGAVR